MVSPIAAEVVSSGETPLAAKERQWRRYAGVLLCIVLSGLFLYLAVRKTNLLEVRKAWSTMHLYWLLPMVAISLIDFWLRAVRWSWMFPPNGRPTVRQTFSVFTIGTMTNNIVPGRMGDIARAAMIGRRVPLLGSSGSLATVVLEKVLDGLMLLAFLGVTLLTAPLPSWLGKTGALGSAMFVGALLFLLAINTRGKRINLVVKASFLGKLLPTVQGVLRRFAIGLNALNNKKQTLVVILLTLAIWLLEFVLVFVVFQVFSLGLPFVAAVVTAVIVSVGMMLPAAPASIGSYQFFTMTGLQLYNVPESQALALGIFLNLFVFANSTVLGLLSLSIDGLTWFSPLKTHD